MSVNILIGDALTQLKALPAESVHCCVTSPPYWGLRAYQGDPGMIGLEPTFDEHLANLVAVFREMRRVLRPDGTLWLNYGDAYSKQGSSIQGASGQMGDRSVQVARQDHCRPRDDHKPKDLLLMPARVAMALQADGWWLRSEIIWHKPNPMPESVTDRPTSAHEKVFLLSKAARYFYDAAAVRLPSTPGSAERQKHPKPGIPRRDGSATDSGIAAHAARVYGSGEESGANLRNVWTIATQAYSDAHFATFPEALVIPCIKAGTSEKGVCAECGAPWVREVAEACEWTDQRETLAAVRDDAHRGNETSTWASNTPGVTPKRRTKGWSPSCTCSDSEFNVSFVGPAVVLDPFAGSGTVGLVADKLGRDAILIEISAEYAEMARRRIQGDSPLFAEVV